LTRCGREHEQQTSGAPARRPANSYPHDLDRFARSIQVGAVVTGPFGIAGPRLIELGYCALRIPRGLKHPNIEKWREEYTRRKPTQQEIDAWSASGAGVGIITGAAFSDVVGVGHR
jgi:hypothetical protein